ncbi:MAG: lysophospholipid acyltransferase family protein [candidate division KSB1 bacterium]|nr:lysophospholipid acyltransferase family protein [candidate division KSB1 bacterium]MDZ7272886.1 lysophospholipid acyltransferase family protein [candidate division KSB1 bacterium]MDZ7284091.1 lysophospholipid acyltransferase family protein [candidate division KSB1 bacterium]MDZ7297511.1 lysophospholipid acyltransferase family protein [candidate division KSB1 bacterium]MDZ7308247.1 lysophospholipid acyltransferase family protein [candidate division KSB1 bacterium]
MLKINNRSVGAAPRGLRLSRWRRITFWLATRFGWLALLLIGHWTRIRLVGRQHFERLRASGTPFLICTWHGKILIPIFVHRRENLCGMVSEHSDGEMIAQTLHRLGYRTVRGSSTRGGSRAMIAMIRALRSGAAGAIMPDGPKGPRHHFKAGAIAIAQKAGACLLPLTFASSSCWRLKSWDQFIIPKPFSRTIVLYGEPRAIAASAGDQQLEALRQQMEQDMLALEAEAERQLFLPAPPQTSPTVT